MNTQPVPNKKGYKNSRKRAKKRRRRRRFLFFTVVLITCIFTVRAIQNRSEKNNTADDSSPVLASTSGANSISTKERSARKDFLICLDPGHGYDDPGCDSEYLGDYAEEDINLSIALLIRDKLQKYGFTVIMTRDSDVIPEEKRTNKTDMYTVSSRKRCDFSNNNGADLFLSIHCNFFKDKDVSGTRLYYYVDNSGTVEAYASLLETGINNILGAKCLVSANTRKESYDVCYFTKAPAVLAEVGFVSNPEDAEKLLDSKWQNKYAESIVQGMINYFKEFCYNTDSNVNNAK